MKKGVHVIRKVCKIAKTASQLRHVGLSLRSPFCSRGTTRLPAPTRKMFMKCDIYFSKISKKIFSLKHEDKNTYMYYI